ncbi:MAG TPA: aldo/keto reductase [Anaerolineae bacterium]|jgi:predicted aldo/keto reductase-like oxidoreductase
MIPTQPFGRTGHLSTVALFGAAALGRVTQSEADRTLDVLLEYGVNHIDTAASYGESEDHIGPWMAKHRKDFFLATKTGQRTYQAAKDEFHKSLDRLRVDSVDLIQLHYLVNPDEWATAMGPGGALEALIEAREQKLVRFIGVTGHDLTVVKMHLRSLEKFNFDSVLLPYNYVLSQNAQYMADFRELLAVCQKRNVAFQTIKSITRGPWGEKAHFASTWYEPLTEQSDIDKAVNFVLSQPGIFLNTSGDIHVMPKVLNAVSRFNAELGAKAAGEAAATLKLEPLFLV